MQFAQNTASTLATKPHLGVFGPNFGHMPPTAVPLAEMAPS
jgi:hypothetical protein